MSKRIYMVDILRAFAIINMIIYHTLYDLKYIFYLDMPYFSASSWYYYQQYICISFIFLSGFSANFSKKLLKNSIKLSLIASIITIVTTMVSRELAIYFGVIHLLSISMIFIYFFDKIYKINAKNTHIFLFTLSMICFIYFKSAFWNDNKLYSHIYDKLSALPLSFAYGFPKADFYSADYFPIIPWIFLFISGYFMGKYYKLSFSLQKLDDTLKNSTKKYTTTLSYIARYSLIIYVLHQVIIYAVLYVIFIIIVKFN